MAKINNKKEKSKFYQTKLCFTSSPAKPLPKETIADPSSKLENSIQRLDIGDRKKKNEHPSPCANCNRTIPRVQCTALREKSDTPCTFSFCTDCIKKTTGEDLDWINNNNANFVAATGRPIKHRSVLTNNKWACLICRGICPCEHCKNTAPRLVFNTKTTSILQPPELMPIDLIYSEEEIWIRLQIRELLFRFGDLYKFDYKYIASLQNAQGDWRLKRLGAYIVCHVLTILSTSTHYDLTCLDTEDTIPQMAKRILNGWMTEKRLNQMYMDTQTRHQALIDVILQEGMSGKRWLEIAELLAAAQVENIPIPTSRDLVQKTKSTDDMDIDEEERIQEIELKLRRFQKSSRSLSLLSLKDELSLIHMLLELILFEQEAKQSLIAPNKTKEIELEFKKRSKEFFAEDIKNKSRKNALKNRMTQLSCVRDKEEELGKVQVELDSLETYTRDERLKFETHKIEHDTYMAKAQRRTGPLGTDHLGNEYWLFSNMLSLHHGNDLRNSEPHWAYGVIIIGPGFMQSNERKWWSLRGKQNLSSLADWLKQEERLHSNEALGSIANKVYQRIEYLTALEWVVYGDGYFS
ncbi:hypothetical protein BD560DRAFT_393207 [Blakeslea trispora]|nr:hypothetical protein BD560DRAFT_393207 [Blakeslea trispora]